MVCNKEKECFNDLFDIFNMHPIYFKSPSLLSTNHPYMHKAKSLSGVLSNYFSYSISNQKVQNRRNIICYIEESLLLETFSWKLQPLQKFWLVYLFKSSTTLSIVMSVWHNNKKCIQEIIKWSKVGKQLPYRD